MNSTQTTAPAFHVDLSTLELSPDLTARGLRGADLARKPGRIARLSAWNFQVLGQGGAYDVDLAAGSCTCADHKYRKDASRACYHRVACETIAAREPAPVAAPRPAAKALAVVLTQDARIEELQSAVDVLIAELEGRAA